MVRIQSLHLKLQGFILEYRVYTGFRVGLGVVSALRDGHRGCKGILQGSCCIAH